MYARFGLVLMLTHACPLRCVYCYTGEKAARRMPPELARHSIDRAIASVEPGGTLELGFFGGEPLLEAPLLLSLIEHANARAARKDVRVRPGLTTSGTATSPDAWKALLLPELDLSVSHDGLPEVHDLHRRGADASATSARVVETMERLQAEGKEFNVVAVVRPGTVDRLAEGMEFLEGLGVRRVEPSLDLWTRWTEEDVRALEASVARCARFWQARLPGFGVAWFDLALARLSRVPCEESARCGFGDGEVAVAPSGRLYPCERLIGEDREDNPMRLPGHALEGEDFLARESPAERSHPSCDACVLQPICSTTCRCSNWVRTGDSRTPDGLLCRLDKAVFREVARAMMEMRAETSCMRS